ncbi:MAG: hypothetical protein EPO09_09005 [Aquabacterium sp.]|uniref:hypothetical protein n=1 Tax=Aquabacterium sp. TaxID=1872578 RepID=UPI0012198455|nr:hypothetical protein [Aquabacterium sp.]TAK94743.1 MAG: hypothetical protein EPO09_09005 [Aquabacterium sp.]
MYAAALFKTIEEAGIAVLTLVEGVQDSELLASRLTRQEVTRQMRLMLEAATALPSDMREAMPEIDWSGMATVGKALSGSTKVELDEALVFCSRALTPALMMWLRVYQQQHPDWFKMRPPAR